MYLSGAVAMFVIEDDEPEAETEVVVQAMEKQPPSRASDDNDILDCGSGLPEPLPCQTSVSAAKSGHQHVNRNGAPGSNKRKASSACGACFGEA